MSTSAHHVTDGVKQMDFTSADRERPEKFSEQHEPWEALACAIIKMACEDYITALGSGRQSIERFIMSDRFRQISDIDPEWLVKNLRETFRPLTGMIRG